MPRQYITTAALAGLLTATSAHAATETTNLNVTAIVADTCILAAGTAMSFATIDTTKASNETIAGLVTVTCTSNKSDVTVTLGGGANADGTQRRMKESGGAFLPYNVYSDSGHSSTVAVGGEIYNDDISAAIPKLISVYGQIPAGSYSAGAYSDTLLVTLTY